MFDEGQELHTPYHRTKFEAEKLVREKVQGAWRVYRPSIVVGNSKTGEMDKIDGPYYFFKVIQKLRHALPEWAPLVSVEWGWTEPRPGRLRGRRDRPHRPRGGPRRAGLPHRRPEGRSVRRRDQHVRARRPRAARGHARGQEAHEHAPEGRPELRDADPGAQGRAQVGARRPRDPRRDPRRRRAHRASSTRATPSARCAGSGIELPELESYADKLWDYWERNLDPDLFKDRSFEGAVNGRTVVITGASSGIGRAAALKIAAAGGIPILVARSLDKLEELTRRDRGRRAAPPTPTRPTSPTTTRSTPWWRRSSPSTPSSTCWSTTPAARSGAR